METFSALLAICAGNSSVTGEFPTQRPVTRSFDVFFDLRLNKRLSKQSWGWWFETLSRPLWRHSNALETLFTCYKSYSFDTIIWPVLMRSSCGDTCQIWMPSNRSNWHFWQIINIGKIAVKLINGVKVTNALCHSYIVAKQHTRILMWNEHHFLKQTKSHSYDHLNKPKGPVTQRFTAWSRPKPVKKLSPVKQTMLFVLMSSLRRATVDL